MKKTRTIVDIDRDKCNGCGLCASACHEGAIQMIDGKATLVSDAYCDGLGACLPACPVDAIHLIEREADAFDEALVQQANQQKQQSVTKTSEHHHAGQNVPCGCPSTHARALSPAQAPVSSQPATSQVSALGNWPVQIQLANPMAPYFQNARLLVAADCTAYAYAGMHQEFMKDRVTLIGCPKLDDADYADKLATILTKNDIRSVTVMRMEVPCCGGIVNAVRQALKTSGKTIPYREVTVTIDGQIQEA